MKIWVLVIEHRHGFNHYANRTIDGVYQTLYDYVNEWWKDLDYSDRSITDFTQVDAVNYYFDNIYEEWFTLQEVILGE